MLESLLHQRNSFITLTYAEKNLTYSANPADGTLLPTLQPLQLQTWLKRFRKAIEPDRMRFFAVGEYGNESARPHYHIAAFGYPSCQAQGTVYPRAAPGSDEIGRPRCCEVCGIVHDTWGHGRVFVGTLELHSAQYIAGYVTKKLTAPTDPKLKGRYPEFTRMSRRPGIGADAMHDVASTLLQFNLERSQADVPVSLRHGGRSFPLGRYLRSRLRPLIGKDEKCPDEVLQALAEELRPLREMAFDSSQSFKKVVVEASEGRALQIEGKLNIFKKRGSI